MTTEEGQTIQLNIIDPTQHDNDTSLTDYGYIVDGGEEHRFTSLTPQPDGHIEGQYMSMSNKVTLVLLESSHNMIVTYHGKHDVNRPHIV